MADATAALLRRLTPAEVDYKPLRITQQQSMTKLISMALEHLQSSATPILLHTLAPSAPSTSTQPTSTAPAPPAPLPTPRPAPTSTRSERAIPTDPSLAKLISCAEIVKRTWVSPPAAPPPAPVGDNEAPPSRKRKRARGAAGAVVGLHQYTYLGAREEHGLATPPSAQVGRRGEQSDEEEKRHEEVMMDWLKGGAGKGKRPRMRHTPFLLILLTPSRITALDTAHGFSYQPPSAPPAPPASKPEPEPQTSARAESLSSGAIAVAVAGAGEEGPAAVGPGEAEEAKKKRKRKRPAVRPKAKARAKAAMATREETTTMDVDDAGA